MDPDFEGFEGWPESLTDALTRWERVVLDRYLVQALVPPIAAADSAARPAFQAAFLATAATAGLLALDNALVAYVGAAAPIAGPLVVPGATPPTSATPPAGPPGLVAAMASFATNPNVTRLQAATTFATTIDVWARTGIVLPSGNPWA